MSRTSCASWPRRTIALDGCRRIRSRCISATKEALASHQKSMALRESLARESGSHRDQVELAAAYLAYGEFQAGAAGNTRPGFDYVTQALAILDREYRPPRVMPEPSA